MPSLALPLGLATLAVTGAALYWGLTERRWTSPTYCIERPGHLWSGHAGPLPSGFTAQCPTSDTYRAEVRRGETRVEQYVASGWRPRDLAQRFRDAGFRLLDGEFINPDLYEAFFDRPGEGKIYYLASRQNGTTVVTINGGR